MTTSKDLSTMIAHGTSLESALEMQTGYLTPNERFFVCSSGSTPCIDSTDYSLRIHGDGVREEVVFNYQDLLAMRQHLVPAILECAGNHRTFFKLIDNRAVETPAGTAELIWSTGAVGMAEWQGVSLCDVLSRVSLHEEAQYVCASGSETDSCEGTVSIPLPLHKAMDPDTLLALQMNGVPLPAEHGFPVRVLVPGWIGAYSVKWVQDIEVSCRPIWVRRNTSSYILKGMQWPQSQFAPAEGAPITDLNIKSSLALPWPANLTAGVHTLHGYARAPGSPVTSVQWSDDNGAHWHQATLDERNEKYGWVRFEFSWRATPGENVLMTRATDKAGNTQPAQVAYNEGGYLYNAVHPHPVSVR